MSRYFIDTEFLEGKQDKRFLGIKYGETKPTIDLISIALVSEDGREYYAIHKDFNLYEAWNRYDLKRVMNSGDMRNHIGDYSDIKVYWIRDNVLKPIFDEWKAELNGKIVRLGIPIPLNEMPFTYKNFKYCIKCIGKTNEQIAEDIKWFIADCENNNELSPADYYSQINKDNAEIFYKNTEFYGYYSDYDWVVFCWLFGRMINLPKGFPMFAYDIQQLIKDYDINKDELKKEIPQLNCHNALEDAKWNYNAYKFIKNKIDEKR